MYQFKNDDKAPSKSIFELTSEGPSFSVIAAALRKAGMVDVLSGRGPFTVFAPSDQAFKKLPHGALEALMKDKAKLKAVLNYHIAAGRLLLKNLRPGDLMTLEGGYVRLKMAGGIVEVNGARIMGADVLAVNGIMHIIDAILLPKNVRLLTEAA
jgi:uncharacterized surface protein with fasciclin (FAS1) repeats